MIDFIITLFWIFFWIALILFVLAILSFNRLRGLREEVREKRSNVRGSVKKMVDVLNKAGDVVKGYKGFEQVTQLKVSQDSTATSLMSTVQQSSTMMATLQGAAQRFPDLKASGLYQELMADIRKCHNDIEEKGQEYNKAVKGYNKVALGMPAILYARLVGFGREEYLNFDTGGMEEHVGIAMSFDSEDDERVGQLLQSAGSHLLGASKGLALQAGQMGKAIAGQAGQAGKLLAARVKEQSTAKYFYMTPGGVPKGPALLQEIQELLAQGVLNKDLQVAETGSQDWKPLDQAVADAAQPPKPPTI